MHARVVGQLRMERRDEEAPVAQQHRLAVQLGEHLDVRPELGDPRRADEDPAQRLVLAVERQVGLEARDLAAVGVPVDRQVDQAEVRPGRAGSSRAVPNIGPVKRPHRLVDAVEPHQAHDRRRLAAGDDQPVEPFELLGLAHLDDLGAEARSTAACSRKLPCTARTPIRAAVSVTDRC